MCSTTNSFRSVYQSSRRICSLPSYRRRFQTGTLKTLEGEHKSSRRVGNDALREFIQCIHLEDDGLSNQLFSCKRCEVDMTESDFKQLGMDSEGNEGLKRLSSVVIDAKVVPLLKDMEKFGDPHETLRVTPGLQSRIMRTTETKNALRLFLKTVRSSIAQARRMDFGNERSGRCEQYEMCDGQLYIRLGAMSKHGKTKRQCSRSSIIDYIGIIRWYIDPQTCLCQGSARTLSMNHPTCASRRMKLEETGGKEVVRNLLSLLFEIVTCPPNRGEDGVRNGNDGVQDGTSEESGEEADGGEQDTDGCTTGETFGPDEAWVRLKVRDVLQVEEQLDAVLELGMFCVLDPISLGFFPFRGVDGMGNAEQIPEKPPTTGEVEERPEGGSGRGRRRRTVVESEVSDLVKKLAPESINLHWMVATALAKISTCTHDVPRDTLLWMD